MKHLLLSLACLALLENPLCAATPADASNAEKTIGSVSALVLAAKKPEDLDDLLKKLNDLSQPRGPAGFHAGAQADLMRLQAADRFVKGWQDYLAASVAGDQDRIKNTLENILRSQQFGDPIFVPRSQILERESPSNSSSAVDTNADYESSDVILDHAKSVDDLETALNKIDEIPPGKSDSTKNLDWRQLHQLVLQCDNVRQGMPVTVELNALVDGPVMGYSLSRVKAMIFLYLLPRYFGTEQSDPPKADESLRAYLERLKSSAIAKENWPLLQKVMGAQMKFSLLWHPSNQFGQPTTFNTGSQCFLAGLSQEVAGQYEFAVRSYQQALKETDDFLPVAVVGQRLAAIKAAHPEDFEKGVDDFLHPPADSTPQNPFAPPAFGQRQFNPINPMNNPNLPGYIPPSTPVSVLPIPDKIEIPGKAKPDGAALAPGP
jgi:hypothetical protein